MALLKTIGRTGQKLPQATSASQALGPAPWPILGAAGTPQQLSAGSVWAHHEHAPPIGWGWKPTPLQKAQRAPAGRAGQQASGGGGLRSHHAGMLGPGSLSEPPYGPASRDPGWEPSRGLGPGPQPSRPLHQAICQRLFLRGAAPGEASWGWGQADVWGLLAEAPAIPRSKVLP